MRRLKGIPGHPRVPGQSRFPQAIDRWIDREAKRFDCSRSMVIDTCVSIVSGIEEEDYRQDEKKRKSRPPARVLRMHTSPDLVHRRRA